MSVNTDRLREIVVDACEGEDPAETGVWERRGSVEYRLALDKGGHIKLDYARVEPAWSEGDVHVLAEIAAHADYIAALNPAVVWGMLDELDRLRAWVDRLRGALRAEQETCYHGCCNQTVPA